jgi:undecaprenol kinase/diacylglycerol kinase (ATP)
MKRLIKSFGYAFEGIQAAIKTERNFQIHLVAALLVIALGLYVGLPSAKWCLVAVAIGFVLVSELFNTSIERLSIEVADGKQNPAIKTVKDVSAAAVFFSALTALVIGILVLFIPLVGKISSL